MSVNVWTHVKPQQCMWYSGCFGSMEGNRNVLNPFDWGQPSPVCVWLLGKWTYCHIWISCELGPCLMESFCSIHHIDVHLLWCRLWWLFVKFPRTQLKLSSKASCNIGFWSDLLHLIWKQEVRIALTVSQSPELEAGKAGAFHPPVYMKRSCCTEEHKNKRYSDICIYFLCAVI